jgi:hypothetical protein
LSGGLYFAVSSIGRTSRLRPTLAGFFLAAAVATNLFATLLVMAVVVAYLYGRAKVDRVRVPQRVAADAVWFFLGAAVLLGACGWFARAHGGRFFLFLSSVEALNDFSTSQWKLPTYDWMLGEPRLLVPVFVAATAAVAWRRHRAGEWSVVGAGVTAAGAALFVFLTIWEFARSGTFLQIPYYFSTIYPFLLVGLATAVYAVLERGGEAHRLRAVVLVPVGVVAAAAPLVVIYGSNSSEFWGRRGAVITVALMSAAWAAAIGVRIGIVRRWSPAVAVVTAAVTVASVSHASAASVATYRSFETHNSPLSDADETFAMGAQLITFMQRSGLQDSLPAFWYDPTELPALTGVQSLLLGLYVAQSRDAPC